MKRASSGCGLGRRSVRSQHHLRLVIALIKAAIMEHLISRSHSRCPSPPTRPDHTSGDHCGPEADQKSSRQVDSSKPASDAAEEGDDQAWSETANQHQRRRE